MRICHNKKELAQLLSDPRLVSKEFPITVSKFIEDAREIELDAVAAKGRVVAQAITEHVENAGVHSGDASIVLPSQNLNAQTRQEVQQIGIRLAKELTISGPFNIQFLTKDHQVSVIEINLRASRTFPFISKVTGVDFIKLAVDAFFGHPPTVMLNSFQHLDKRIDNHKGIPKQVRDDKKKGFVAVKVPQFSFARLTGADPILHVEMASTGEVACFGADLEEAFLKGELAVGGKIPKKGIFVSLGGEANKRAFLESVGQLTKLGLRLFATEKTAGFLGKHGIEAKILYKIYEKRSPNILEYFQGGKVDLVINLLDPDGRRDEGDHYTIRRAAIDYNIPIYTNLQKAALFARALAKKPLSRLTIASWDHYV